MTSKFAIRKKPKPRDDEDKEIGYSVFVAPGYSGEFVEFGTLDHNPPMTKAQFDAVAESVRTAIRMGVHPRMIRQGSSGSYFVSNSSGKTVGIFKPKNEEPYGKLNPKWTKWLHRNLFPCFFGRSWYLTRLNLSDSSLIPNLSYISEAAACVLDRQLKTYIVPHTEIVWLSSKAFNYDWFDRRAYYRKGKPLPQKVGSFQIFLDGFRGTVSCISC